jgi:osomolarity two-component system response regulator SKN7
VGKRIWIASRFVVLFELATTRPITDIQRKAVIPKKGEEAEGSTGGKTEDATRLAEMEGRVSRLEDQLAMALDELRQARTRELSLHTWAREMITHVGQVERGKLFPANNGSN